jgi:arylsulfatase A-like enzyme
MSKRWVVTAAVVVAIGFTVWRAQVPGRWPGEARLDLSVYIDPFKDRQPVTDVVRPSAQAPSRRPNVVVILADDLGFGDLGAYGNTLLRTPNLDALAAAGIRFTDFYASAPTCSPSRAGLLTGRYPIRSGITYPIQPETDGVRTRMNATLGRLTSGLGAVDMAQAGQSAVLGLPDSEITLPEALRLAGYATGMVGKWHLGDFNSHPQYHPLRHGFDFFAGVPHSNDNFPYTYWKNDTVAVPDLDLAQGELTAELTREAIGFIDASAGRPFFLYFAHKNVHTPLIPSPRFAGHSTGGDYGDAVEELDWSVGEVMRALADRKLLDDTLVVFSSDNGPWHLGNPGMLRGRKGQPMEGGQRVPTLVAWRGHLEAGRVVSGPAMNIDLFPTILRLAGLDLPSDRIVDGRDLWPLLAGETAASPHDALFFFHANVIDGVRAERWKYYRWLNLYTWPVPLDKVNTVPGRLAHAHVHTDATTGRTVQLVTHDPLLFDLTRDPNESYDVAERTPDVASRLHAAIDTWETAFFANPRGWK